jgi:small-conductance mechanosensitive channel
MRSILLKFLKPSTYQVKFLLLVLCILFFSLGFLDYFKPIEKFLSSEDLSFKIGTINFSVYLLLKYVLTVAIILWIARLISGFVEGSIKKFKKMRAANKALFIKVIQVFVYFFAGLVLLDILSIDLTAFTIFSGAIGIGIGLGLQKISSNFISGLILLFEKSIEDGDIIELGDGVTGTIKQTSARYTLIEAFDGKEIMIPNEDLATNRVTNWTYSHDKGRVQIEIGVAYQSDLKCVQRLLLESAQEHPRCSLAPEPRCFLREFGESSVNFLLLFWVDDVVAGRFEPQSDVLFTIWHKFQEHNIEIPFPQRDLTIRNPEQLMLRQSELAVK